MGKNEVMAILDKINRSAVPLAIFEKGKSIRVTKTSTDLFRDAFEKMPQALIGVYDDKCRLEWLESDLAHIS